MKLLKNYFHFIYHNINFVLIFSVAVTAAFYLMALKIFNEQSTLTLYICGFLGSFFGCSVGMYLASLDDYKENTNEE